MTELALTDHAAVRMAQRGIAPSDVDLIMAIGSEVEDGVSFGEKMSETSNGHFVTF